MNKMYLGSNSVKRNSHSGRDISQWSRENYRIRGPVVIKLPEQATSKTFQSIKGF